MKCKNCEDGGLMYDQRNGKRCAKCGFKWEPEPVDTDAPMRRVDSNCGEIISSHFEGATRGAVRRLNCTDDTTCSVKVSGLKKLKDKVYMTACYHHE